VVEIMPNNAVTRMNTAIMISIREKPFLLIPVIDVIRAFGAVAAQ
jgi:hypothetical protein